jgi:hypothetical protein
MADATSTDTESYSCYEEEFTLNILISFWEVHLDKIRELDMWNSWENEYILDILLFVII